MPRIKIASTTEITADAPLIIKGRIDIVDDELEVLRKVRDLLLPFDNWTRGALARSSDFRAVSPTSPNASCWCVSGAIGRVTGIGTNNWDHTRIRDTPAYKRLTKVTERLPGLRRYPEGVNDTGGHAVMLEMVDKAIADVIAERTAHAPNQSG